MSKGLIGITGRACAGKDTVARLIKENILPDYTIYTLAGPLKDGVSNLFGWTREQLEDREFKEAIDPVWGFSPRRAMQLFGTEFGRACREDLWVHMAKVRYESPFTLGMIVTDVRFENEAKFIRVHDGLLIHVNRPGEVIAENSHASEAGVAYVDGDATVENNGTFDDLAAKLNRVVNNNLGLWALNK